MFMKPVFWSPTIDVGFPGCIYQDQTGKPTASFIQGALPTFLGHTKRIYSHCNLKIKI